MLIKLVNLCPAAKTIANMHCKYYQVIIAVGLSIPPKHSIPTNNVLVELLPDLHLTQLTLDKGNSLCAILSSVALVGGVVTAVAAVWVWGVAVRLDLTGRRARESRRTCVKLYIER